MELREDMLVGEVMAQKKAQRALDVAVNFKALFDANPEDVATHGFKNIADAIAAVTAAEEGVAKVMARDKVLSDQLSEIRSQFFLVSCVFCFSVSSFLSFVARSLPPSPSFLPSSDLLPSLPPFLPPFLSVLRHSSRPGQSRPPGKILRHLLSR